jgi:CRP-like cAMP-binding protein
MYVETVELPLQTLRDRMLALRSLSTFAGLRDETLLEVSEHSRERRFHPGDELLSPDVPVDRAYIVVSGKVVMSYKDKPWMVVETNSSVGMLAVIGREPLGWRATAERETTTLEIPAAAFLNSLEEDFPLLRNSLKVLAEFALELRGNLPVRHEMASPVAVGSFPERDPTLVERIIAMRQGRSIFATANMDALIELCRRMQLVRVQAGHVFFEVGEPSTFSLRVNSGRMRCTTATGEHVDVGSEMVLGAMDAFAGQPRSYSARAETALSCYITQSEDFLAVLEMHPSLAINMLGNMARSLIAGI